MFKTILVCTDGSEYALKAAQRAARMALQADACVLLLHVNDTGKERLPIVMPWQIELGETQYVPEPNEEQEEALNRTARLLEDCKVHYQCLREHGHVASQIVHVAEREGVDLIVLGSRGLNILKSILLGSVSAYVAHHAPCSVLIVR